MYGFEGRPCPNIFDDEAKNVTSNQAERMAAGYQQRHGGNRQGDDRKQIDERAVLNNLYPEKAVRKDRVDKPLGAAADSVALTSNVAVSELSFCKFLINTQHCANTHSI